MTHKPDEFEKLMGGMFNPEEARSFDTALSGPFVEPLYPGTLELLDLFDAADTKIQKARDEAEKAFYLSKLIRVLEGYKELKTSMPIELNGARSYFLQDQRGFSGYGVFEGHAKVTGEYVGFAVGPWHDVPLGLGLPEDGDETYLRDSGLLIAVHNPKFMSEEYDVESPNNIAYVPLNHGRPELFRVHCPE